MEFSEYRNRTEATKGIIHAAGFGERLHPMTQVVAKELIPVHDKPMVYYPLSTLMLAGIREILIVARPRHLRGFMELLGNGSHLGISISYAEQIRGEGIVETLLVAERFIGGDSVCLLFGDSIFHGSLTPLMDALRFDQGATIFAWGRGRHHRDKPAYARAALSEYGLTGGHGFGHADNCLATWDEGHLPDEESVVVAFDEDGKAVSIEDRIPGVRAEYAVPSVCVFDRKIAEIVRSLGQPATCDFGLVEICREYLRRGELRVRRLGLGDVWFDASTPSALSEAADFIASFEEKRGAKIGCIEEAAFRMGFIDASRLERLTAELPMGAYREYLMRLLAAFSHKPGKGQRRTLSDPLTHPAQSVEPVHSSLTGRPRGLSR